MKIVLPTCLLILSATLASADSTMPFEIKPSEELRLRYENRSDTDFNPEAYDRVYYGAMRARVGLAAGLPHKTELFVQPQFSDYFGGFPVKTADSTFNATLGAVPGAGLFEMHQAHLSFKDIGKSGVNLKVGRQEINLGDQRLIGSFDYSMTARHFDGAVASFAKGATFSADLFAARLFQGPFTKATTPSPRTVSNDPDRAKDIAGVYLRTGTIPHTTLDVYEILYRDGWRQKAGAEDPAAPKDKLLIYTTGARVLVKPVSGLDVIGEYAIQRGHRYDVDHAAYAWAAKATYKVPVLLTPVVAAESIFATGDRSAKDGKSGEFENLFPTNHFKYGAMDLFGWRNIRAQHATLGAEPRKNLGFYVDGWVFHLPETGGPWKNAAGQTVLKPQRGAATHDAGKELDLTGRYALSEKITFLGHYGRFIPGELVKRQSTPDTPAQFAMVQVQTSL